MAEKGRLFSLDKFLFVEANKLASKNVLKFTKHHQNKK